MHRVVSLILLILLLTGCARIESFEGQIEAVKANGLVVDCTEEVNKGKKGAVNAIGYGCFVEYTKETVFLDKDGSSLTAEDFSPGSTVNVVLSKKTNLRNYVEKHRPSVISAKEITLVSEAIKPATLPALPVDRIKKVSVVESVLGQTMGVLADKNHFQTFSDAIAGAEEVTGEIISIGENYEFVVEYESSQQQFSYWNGPHLKMIFDQDRYYFLSDDAVNKIDLLIREVGSNHIMKAEAEQIALKYVSDKNVSSHWKIEDTYEEANYWIVRFGSTKSMLELLMLHIDKMSGE